MYDRNSQQDIKIFSDEENQILIVIRYGQVNMILIPINIPSRHSVVFDW